jgi:hypothetical protein
MLLSIIFNTFSKANDLRKCWTMAAANNLLATSMWSLVVQIKQSVHKARTWLLLLFVVQQQLRRYSVSLTRIEPYWRRDAAYFEHSGRLLVQPSHTAIHS